MRTISEIVRNIGAGLEGDVIVKFQPAPEIKPPRRTSPVKNKSNRTDYSQKYMQEYRKEKGKDYQKIPESVKEFRRLQREKLKDKFNIKG